MSGPERRGGRGWGLMLLGLGTVLALLLWLDHGSLERGNRLFGEGDLEGATRLYQAAVDRADDPASSRYNLGTALLAQDDERADLHLKEAAASPDSSVAQRASYNLGYSLLTRVDAAMEADAALELLAGSIGASRVALRLDPRDENARWNLAVAQRMADSIASIRELPQRQRQAGNDPTRLEDQALTRSGSGEGVSGQEPENPQSGQSSGRRQGATVGTREAWALADPGPMSEEAARRMLRGLSDDPEQLVRGILWAGRPDVAWWQGDAYPGGDW